MMQPRCPTSAESHHALQRLSLEPFFHPGRPLENSNVAGIKHKCRIVNLGSLLVSNATKQSMKDSCEDVLKVYEIIDIDNTVGKPLPEGLRYSIKDGYRCKKLCRSRIGCTGQ